MLKIERSPSLLALLLARSSSCREQKETKNSHQQCALSKYAVLTAPKGLPLQLTALGAPYRTVLTQGNKGETTQNPCVKIIPLRRTICSQFWKQSICNKSICFFIDDILFPFKERYLCHAKILWYGIQMKKIVL